MLREEFWSLLCILAMAAIVFACAVVGAGCGAEDRAEAAAQPPVQAPRPEVTIVPERLDAGLQAAREEAQAVVEEAGRLARAMCGWLTEPGAATRSGLPDRECARREVEGLAYVLTEAVSAEHRAGRWVPLSREKAPAFLAAWSYHEVSWQWRRSPRGRSHGERGPFQFHGVALQWAPRDFETNAYSATLGAIGYFEHLRGVCGEHGWPGAYASGLCGGASDKVRLRFSLARWLLDRIR